MTARVISELYYNSCYQHAEDPDDLTFVNFGFLCFTFLRTFKLSYTIVVNMASGSGKKPMPLHNKESNYLARGREQVLNYK